MLPIGTGSLVPSLVLVLGLSLVSPAGAGQGEESSASEGRSGISFWPDHEDGSDPREAPDLATCEVHYVLKDNRDQESIYPCGTKFWPETGRFFAWLENKGAMSAFTKHGHYAGTSENGMAILTSLAPAGRVALGTDSWPDSMSLRLLHIDSHLRGPWARREIFRRVFGEARSQGVQMPEGGVLAFSFDTEKQEYVGVSRPINVRQGSTQQVAPGPPAEGSDLLVILERPDPVDDIATDDVKLNLEIAGARRAPDVLVRGVYQLHAVWYGLDGRHARLEVASSRVRLPPEEIVLRPGKLEVLEDELQRLPRVSVLFDLPPELPKNDLKLEAVRQGWPEPVYSAEIAEDELHHTIAALPALELEIRLRAPPWILRERIDLRDGVDRSITLSARPFVLTGTVFRGRDPLPAVIAWITNEKNEELRVETDELGRYEAVLFRPVVVVFIEALDTPNARYVDLLDEILTESSTLDFHLPGNRFAVEVVDQETGQGIAEANVSYENRGVNGDATAQETVTGEDGVAWLPPLRPGELEVQASARGYSPAEALPQSVAEDDEERSLRIPLQKSPPGSRLQLRLPDGSPAMAAELLARSSLDGAAFWTGRTDDKGVVTLPGDLESAVFLVRHPGAAFLVRWWSAPADPEAREQWVLQPSAAPLVVHVRQIWDEPAPFAELALRVGDLWLSGGTLAWLTGSRASADASGFWRGQHLPATALEIVASARDASSGPPLTVQPPWPEPLELVVAAHVSQ